MSQVELIGHINQVPTHVILDPEFPEFPINVLDCGGPPV